MRRYGVLMVALVAFLTLTVACGQAEERGGTVGSTGSGVSADLAENRVMPAGQHTSPPAISSSGAPAPQDAASSKASGQPGGGDTASTLADLAIVERKIIYNAQIDLAVDDVNEAFAAAQRIAQGAGGIVSASNFYTKDDQRLASVTLRVPVDSYQEVLSQLRQLAVEVRSETSNAKDITEEFTDLESRLRNLEATELRYLELLGRAQNIEEILRVQDRINATRAEIEQVKGRMQLLENLSDMATIQAQIQPFAAPTEEPRPGGWNPSRIARDAWENSLAAMQAVAGALITISIYLVWLAIPAVIVLAVWRRVAGLPLIDRRQG